jgi:STAS-like domain of unknown function (DUF4325)
MPVQRLNNLIIFDELNQPTVGSDLIFLIKEILAEGYKIVKLDFTHVTRIFPNAAVPVSTIIDYFKNEKNIVFERIDANHRINERYLLSPLETGQNEDILYKSPLNKVWKFKDSADVNVVVDELVLDLRRSRQFEPGFLDSLTWSLNEVMDNVLQHSARGYGFVMGQTHHQRKHIAFCVGDNGQGIYNSLKNSVHQPSTPIDALKIAVKESVTRDKEVGQGNGMYGLHQIVKFNKGRLTIISNTALYKLEEDNVTTLSNIPTISQDNGGTTIDFQLHYENKVSIEEALIFNGKPHTNYVNYYLENLENDEGDLVYSLKQWRDGVGTRPSGKKLRLEILNNYLETKRRFVIDFRNLNVISSSFADELLGKLVIEFGFFGFNNLVKLKNMNALIQQIVQRSVAQRMSESLNSPKIE